MTELNPAEEYHLDVPGEVGPPDILKTLNLIDTRLFSASLAASNFMLERMNQELSEIKDIVEAAQAEITWLRSEKAALQQENARLRGTQ